MVMNVATLATSLKAQELGLEVGIRMIGMAQDALEDQGDALAKLMESTKVLELSVNPHLGSNLDVSG